MSKYLILVYVGKNFSRAEREAKPGNLTATALKTLEWICQKWKNVQQLLCEGFNLKANDESTFGLRLALGLRLGLDLGLGLG